MGDFAYLAGDVGSDFAKNQVLRIFKNNDNRTGLSRTAINETHQIGTVADHRSQRTSSHRLYYRQQSRDHAR